MLANGGELNGVRVLSPASVQLMSSNHLAPNLLTGEFSIGLQVMRPGFGYGYNCAVVFDPALANLPDGRGTFFWDGAAGTWFWDDPTAPFPGKSQCRISKQAVGLSGATESQEIGVTDSNNALTR